MKTIDTIFVYKHGEDDFSFWHINIDERDYKAALTDYVSISGEVRELLEKLPDTNSEPETVLHFLFNSEARSTVVSTQVDKAFLTRYRDRGYSSRGSADEIIAEFEEYLRDMPSETHDAHERYTLYLGDKDLDYDDEWDKEV